MSYRGGSGRGGERGGGRGGGRGEYYKNKYARSRLEGAGGEPSDAPRSTNTGGSYADLKRVLSQIDGRQYPAYHDLETSKGWRNDDVGFSLYIARTQSDPFAPPTRCRVLVSASAAQFPPFLYSNKIRAIGLTDYLQRALYANCQAMGANSSLNGESWSGPKGGDIQVLEPCQHVLEQSAVTVDLRTGDVRAHVTINLPARGRTVLGKVAGHIFDRTLTDLVQQSLKYSALNASRLEMHVDSIEDQHWLQQQLKPNNLVAFVPNGAILPRASGVDDRPITGSVVLFQSPPRLQVSFTLPKSGREVAGMGIPNGITLICGGGFHGKSTLLQAIQVGVYPKLPGDGREFCVTSSTAIKIRAEDGRNVSAVDISPFISNLPFGKDTTCFSTPDASGSTSQASNIVEVRCT
jgi:predicted ABC-class ATPase